MGEPKDLERQFTRWSPAAQEKARDILTRAQDAEWRPFYCPIDTCDGKPHDDWGFSHARADQRPPRGRWLTWLLMGGRGAGKTRAGSEWSHRMARKFPRGALIAPTGADARDIMLEGDSGLLITAHPQFRPTYEPSKRRVTWPNGSIATVFSAEEPNRLRGPNHFWAWGDEPAHWPFVKDAWDNLLFGLRLGRSPHICATTTPRPTPWLKALLKEERTILSRASTYANIHNLSPEFAEAILKRYEGTRIGRQEIHAEVLSDVEGALWSWEMIEPLRMERPDDLERIVVGVDPAGSSGAQSDETGIVVAGIKDGESYILADRSGRYSPHGWASMVQSVYEEFHADAVVAETNFGGEMVTATMRATGLEARIITIHAKRAKALRAEPIVGLYEQGRVHHCAVLSELETQMTEWVPFDKGDSPDRLDAMVYAVTELMRRSIPAGFASPTDLRRVDGRLRIVHGGAA